MDDFQRDVMIAADNLTKVYGSFPAIQDISFTCRRGEIVGFLGPNGAGKTTTMRILTGYMPPTAGAAYIAGHNTISESIQARERLGYLPETIPLYPEMTVEGYLAFVGRIRRLDDLWERIDDVLEDVHLLDRAESYIGALSKGMRQRVGLAQALLHDPEVLILDEPTIGLDPKQVVEVRQLIKELGERHTILLSTHILSEVEQLCDRVIMVINGRIWADMPLADIVGAEVNQNVVLTLASPTRDTVAVLNNLVGVGPVEQVDDRHFAVTYDGSEETRAAIAATAVNAGWGLLNMNSETLTLEAVFLDKMREAESASLVAVEELLMEEEE
ncbi:MAG TPA: ATP-binding cassette domain-containing protein [Candidatus Sulfomarinibacteraceae bacterium]|nr:ATP-binding cassette domain-containing protein [Candidatus Sulfomarinibacteraceae bacterium]